MSIIRAMSTDPTLRRQDRSEPVVAKVLDVACQIIEHRGEHALKIAEIREQTGVTIGSIYHHFGNRDGLVVAAYARIYRELALTDVEEMTRAVAGVKNKKDFHVAVDGVMATLYNDRNSDRRIRRMMVIAAAQHRPELLTAIAEQQDLVNAAFRDHVDEMKKLGIFSEEVDSLVLGVFLQGYAFGRVFDGFATNPVTDSQWFEMSLRVLKGLESS